MSAPSPTSATGTSALRGGDPAASSKGEHYRWVKETRFGHWFLGTNVWSRYVVDVALRNLASLRPVDAPRPQIVLDAGCGPGVSLPLLDTIFQPEQIIALDIDPKEILRSQRMAAQCRARVEIIRGDAASLALPDNSVNLLLCHQLLHHVVAQEKILREFHRVLAPGGTLLVAESCRDFIHSAPVRLLFRHPNHVQRTAGEYEQLVRAAGFIFTAENVSKSTPFWTLPDWGFRQKIGLQKKPAQPEPTEIYIAATKPRT
ncbi:class I SAM-dependent methyltransferase [Oleiharenicola lentus]|uniref:class I SAM-dependent methyltransferase n=1 Tax=Oleiharenicola lentus TaxID=2508720 RepID=UPI003F664BF4